MNKLSVIIFMGLLLARSGLAIPGLDLLQQQFANGPIVQGAGRTSSCVNFSGLWKGKCVSSMGTSQEESLEIQQTGCDYLKIGNEIVPLAGLDGHLHNSPAKNGGSLASSISLTTDWNAEGTELTTQFAGLIRAIGMKWHFPFIGKAVMKLVGSQLISEMKLPGFTVSCTYEK
ncbi:MAG: hypothetical protein HY537_08775 [Deltaproteobacteria bacterium]|nr:hypothetical protein [Deltaproteobacteria bacterium]